MVQISAPLQCHAMPCPTIKLEEGRLRSAKPMSSQVVIIYHLIVTLAPCARRTASITIVLAKPFLATRRGFPISQSLSMPHGQTHRRLVCDSRNQPGRIVGHVFMSVFHVFFCIAQKGPLAGPLVPHMAASFRT